MTEPDLMLHIPTGHLVVIEGYYSGPKRNVAFHFQKAPRMRCWAFYKEVKRLPRKRQLLAGKVE